MRPTLLPPKLDTEAIKRHDSTRVAHASIQPKVIDLDLIERPRRIARTDLRTFALRIPHVHDQTLQLFTKPSQ